MQKYLVFYRSRFSPLPPTSDTSLKILFRCSVPTATTPSSLQKCRPFDELYSTHISHNRMNSNALHCMDINYSGFTKSNSNKSVLLKNLKGKQINRKPVMMVLKKHNLHAIIFKPSMCIVQTVYCRSHKNKVIV